MKNIRIVSEIMDINDGVVEYNNGNLKIIGLTKSGLTIQENAFRSRQDIHTIHISGYIKSISSHAFINCENLKVISISSDMYCSIGHEAFLSCPNLSYVIINGSILSIGPSTFRSCETLQQVLIMSDELTLIGSNAFADCTSLRYINIPDSVEFIGIDAFRNTSLPEKFKDIGGCYRCKCGKTKGITMFRSICEECHSNVIYDKSLPRLYKGGDNDGK